MIETHRLIHINELTIHSEYDLNEEPLDPDYERFYYNSDNEPMGARYKTEEKVVEPRFTALICHAQIPEAQAETYFENQDSSDSSWQQLPQDVKYRHLYCPRHSRLLDLGVNVLRTCQQIYHEARYLLYSFNTFSFTRPTTLENFFERLLTNFPSCATAVRSLHLDTAVVRTSSESEWCESIEFITRKLLGVTHLNLNWTLWGWDGESTTDILLAFKKLPLTSVTLVLDGPWIRDTLHLGNSGKSISELQKRAKDVKKAIVRSV